MCYEKYLCIYWVYRKSWVQYMLFLSSWLTALFEMTSVVCESHIVHYLRSWAAGGGVIMSLTYVGSIGVSHWYFLPDILLTSNEKLHNRSVSIGYVVKECFLRIEKSWNEIRFFWCASLKFPALFWVAWKYDDQVYRQLSEITCRACLNQGVWAEFLRLLKTESRKFCCLFIVVSLH